MSELRFLRQVCNKTSGRLLYVLATDQKSDGEFTLSF
jgi:hypothetical protein